MTYGDGYGDALRAIIEEAAAARSALCENELVIRLDNILAIARTALDELGHGDPPVSPSRNLSSKAGANPLDQR